LTPERANLIPHKTCDTGARGRRMKDCATGLSVA
jgi:hypothetical protein